MYYISNIYMYIYIIIYIYICNIYSTVGRSIADIYDPRRYIYLSALRLGKYAAEVIYRAMDRPTVLYILYTMVSAQQTNLLPKNASRNDATFAQKVYRIYATTSQYLSSYGCAITMVYIYIYIYTSSEARLWRASLLRRSVDSVSAKAL